MKGPCVKAFFFFLLFFLFSASVWAKPLAEIRRPGIIITEKDLERYLSYYGPEAEKALSSPAKKQEFLRDLVKMLAVAAKARQEGFDQRPEIRAQLEFVADKFLAKKYLTYRLEKALEGLRFSDEDLELYYRTHPEEFLVPARVRFSALVLKGAEEKALLAEARRLRPQLLQGSLTLSTDLDFFFIRDSGWKVFDRLEGPLRETLKELSPGVWSEPVSLGERVYLLRKIDFEAAKRKPLAEVKEEIRSKLLNEAKRQKLRQIIEEILKEEGARLWPQRH